MPHLLVVDDQRDICETVCAAFDSEGGWRASAALTPAEALDMIERERPDVAVVDAVLRQNSGIHLAREILRRGIPVLLMTGEPETQERLDGLACPYLAKPFRLERLFAEVRALLAESDERITQLTPLLRRLARSRAELRIAIDTLRASSGQSNAGRRPGAPKRPR